MTREGAVLILTRLEKGCDEYAGLTNYAKEALQMAITALEADNVVERIAYMSQLNGGANYFDAFMAFSRSFKRNGEKSEALQTDGGCISRQAAIDEITEYGSGDTIYMSVVELKRRIEHLPPAQPEPCEDTISRADAIRVASGYCHPANVAKELAKLPSVQTEVIRCKDCIRYHEPSCLMAYDGKEWSEDNGFCHVAERRTDGNGRD